MSIDLSLDVFLSIAGLGGVFLGLSLIFKTEESRPVRGANFVLARSLSSFRVSGGPQAKNRQNTDRLAR